MKLTFGTQSFLILPPSGTLEQTQSQAPSSLPKLYFLLLTLNVWMFSKHHLVKIDLNLVNLVI